MCVNISLYVKLTGNHTQWIYLCVLCCGRGNEKISFMCRQDLKPIYSLLSQYSKGNSFISLFTCCVDLKMVSLRVESFCNGAGLKLRAVLELLYFKQDDVKLKTWADKLFTAGSPANGFLESRLMDFVLLCTFEQKTRCITYEHFLTSHCYKVWAPNWFSDCFSQQQQLFYHSSVSKFGLFFPQNSDVFLPKNSDFKKEIRTEKCWKKVRILRKNVNI